MDVFQIKGGHPLKGTVKVSGSKNSALPLFAASLLTDEETILENVPDLSDVNFMAEILTELGADVVRIDSNSWSIRPSTIVHHAPYELVRKMRASICLLGPLVARLRKAEIPMPGGCVIGNRPIDLHVRALQGLGAEVELSGGIVKVEGNEHRDMEKSRFTWVPSIAPSGLAVYDGALFPQWRGNLFIGALVDQEVRRLEIKEGVVQAEEALFAELGMRIRDIRQAPDELLYILTDEGSLVRVRPAQ